MKSSSLLEYSVTTTDTLGTCAKVFFFFARPKYDLPTTTGKNGQPSSKTPVCWGSKQQEALEELVDRTTSVSPPIMAYPDFSKKFTLHTDASKEGLRTVLYQKQNGVMRVIAYTSRALSPAERNYHLHAGKLSFWP